MILISQKNRTLQRMSAMCVYLLSISTLLICSYALAANCGGLNQRACAIFCFEVANSGGSCDSGLLEVNCGSLGCAGTMSDFPYCASNGYCRSPSCGGSNERACCISEQIILGQGPCDSGMIPTPGCSGNCGCLTGGNAIETCQSPSPCGQSGERACCLGESSYIGGCAPGNEQIPGCSGDCYCGSPAFIGASSIGTCQEISPCGGEGERACCLVERIPACDSGLVEVPYCIGNCYCDNGLGTSSSGMCHRFSDCGGLGQRECCIGERSPSCDSGLTSVPGCSGDCYCGNTAFVGTQSSSTCISFEEIEEPNTQWTPSTEVSDECSMRGYADMHMHLFANIGHGGGLFAGEPCPSPSEDTPFCMNAFQGQLAPRGSGIPGTTCENLYCDLDQQNDINDALYDCFATDAPLVSKLGNPLHSPQTAALPPFCPPRDPQCGHKIRHVDHTIGDDTIGSGTKDGSKFNFGPPSFNGWPQWSSTTHQQSYYRWLERAWRGGMRLMVQLAVTNTALCKSSKRLSGVDCDNSMASIDQQLQAAYDFEAFIDQEYNGEGWFKIVKTPIEARRAIAKGKLAVVLGIEVDHLFNCEFPSEQCTYDPIEGTYIMQCDFSDNTPACADPDDPTKPSKDWIREQLAYYEQTWGVRHIFPVHNFDNAFGGAATWQATVEVGNLVVEGHWYKTTDCALDGYGHQLNISLSGFTQFISNLFGFLNVGAIPFRPYPTCNALGLLPLGKFLVDELMNRGMMIDVDHMSNRALDDTIMIAKDFRPEGYPLVASHIIPYDLYWKDTHERMRTPKHLEALRQMGGMVAAMLKDDHLDTDDRGQHKTSKYSQSPVENDCRHSSKAFAQAYLYSADRMDGRVAMGSDFNGVAGHFGPRFGPKACGAIDHERARQVSDQNRLQYPFVLDEFGTFDKQVSGQKTFDFNVDGLAHVGLIPDLIADLKNLGLTQGDLDPLMRSAETYIQTWERARGEPVLTGCAGCEITDVTPPVMSCIQRNLAPVGCTGDLTQIPLTLPEAFDECSTASTPICTPDLNAGFPVGVTSISCTSQDESGNQAYCQWTVRVVDKERPKIKVPKRLIVECEGPKGTFVNLGHTSAYDNCDSDPNLTNDATQPFQIGSIIVSWSAEDEAGNIGYNHQSVTVQDTRAPTIYAEDTSFRCNDAVATPIALTPPTVKERCDAHPLVVSNAPPTLPIGSHAVLWTATDASGNIGSTTQMVHITDRAPPAIECPENIIIECNQQVGIAPDHPHLMSLINGVTAFDKCYGDLPVQVAAPASFGLGDDTLFFSAIDGQGLSASCSTTVTVQDTSPPTFNLTLTPNVLWPPNSRFIEVSPIFEVADLCDPLVAVSLESVSSTEGDVTQQFRVEDGRLYLQAARIANQLTGRTYTVTYRAIDASGNITLRSQNVRVPLRAERH